MNLLRRSPKSAADLGALLTKLGGEREAAKQRLADHLKSIGAAAVDGGDVETLNEQKRAIEDDLAATESQIAEVDRRFAAANAEEAKREQASLWEEQRKRYLAVHERAGEIATMLAEIHAGNVRLAALGAVAPGHRRPFDVARDEYRRETPAPSGYHLGHDETVRQQELQEFVQNAKLVVGRDYASGPVSTILQSMKTIKPGGAGP